MEWGIKKMRTITKNLYTFAELSESAKQTALQWWREDVYYHAEDNLKSFDSFASDFNLSDTSWVYGRGHAWARGDISVDHDDQTAGMSPQRLATWIYNRFRFALWSPKYIGHYHTKDGQYVARYSNCQVSDAMPTGYCMDYMRQPLRDFIAKPCDTTWQDLINLCLESWAKDCDADYDYAFSIEALAESCEANGYEFDEKGNIS